MAHAANSCVRKWEAPVLRRLFFTVLFFAFVAVAGLSSYLLYGRWLALQTCADTWGRCYDAATGMQNLEPTGIALAYAAATFVLGLLTMWSLAGMLRGRRRRAHA